MTRKNLFLFGLLLASVGSFGALSTRGDGFAAVNDTQASQIVGGQCGNFFIDPSHPYGCGVRNNGNPTCPFEGWAFIEYYTTMKTSGGKQAFIACIQGGQSCGFRQEIVPCN